MYQQHLMVVHPPSKFSNAALVVQSHSLCGATATQSEGAFIIKFLTTINTVKWCFQHGSVVHQQTEQSCGVLYITMGSSN
jgi:hypothetical protein